MTNFVWQGQVWRSGVGLGWAGQGLFNEFGKAEHGRARLGLAPQGKDFLID